MVAIRRMPWLHAARMHACMDADAQLPISIGRAGACFSIELKAGARGPGPGRCTYTRPTRARVRLLLAVHVVGLNLLTL